MRIVFALVVVAVSALSLGCDKEAPKPDKPAATTASTAKPAPSASAPAKPGGGGW